MKPKYLITALSVLLIAMVATGPYLTYTAEDGRVIGAYALPTGETIIISLRADNALVIAFASLDGSTSGPVFQLTQPPETVLVAVCGNRLKIIANNPPNVAEYVILLDRDTGMCTQRFWIIYLPQLDKEVNP